MGDNINRPFATNVNLQKKRIIDAEDDFDKIDRIIRQIYPDYKLDYLGYQGKDKKTSVYTDTYGQTYIKLYLAKINSRFDRDVWTKYVKDNNDNVVMIRFNQLTGEILSQKIKKQLDEQKIEEINKKFKAKKKKMKMKTNNDVIDIPDNIKLDDVVVKCKAGIIQDKHGTYTVKLDVSNPFVTPAYNAYKQSLGISANHSLNSKQRQAFEDSYIACIR